MKKILLSISVLFSASYYSQVSLSQSLTACYALDGNANEPINALTGTLSAVTPTVNRFSQPNTALYFNGTTSSFVRLPNNALIKPNAVSFSCWAITNISNVAQYLEFTTNGCGSFYEGYALVLIPVGPTFQAQVVKATSACSQTALYGTTTTLATNTWYHFGLYAGPDSLKLYVNGVLNGSLANSNPLAYSSVTNVYLGGTNQSPNFPLNGSIDNVRIYNRKLNGTEFNQLFTLDPVCQPQPVASFVATPSLAICVGQPVSLVSGTTNTPTAWTWTMTGGSPSISSIANPTVSFSAPGPHTITLVSSNSFGSSSPYSQVLNVVTCIGISENNFASEISIYPNPAKDEFMINGLERGTNIEIFNALGSLIYSGLAESDKEKINIASQKPGIYFVKLSLNGKSHTTKFLKE